MGIGRRRRAGQRRRANRNHNRRRVNRVRVHRRRRRTIHTNRWSLPIFQTEFSNSLSYFRRLTGSSGNTVTNATTTTTTTTASDGMDVEVSGPPRCTPMTRLFVVIPACILIAIVGGVFYGVTGLPSGYIIAGVGGGALMFCLILCYGQGLVRVGSRADIESQSRTHSEVSIVSTVSNISSHVHSTSLASMTSVSYAGEHYHQPHQPPNLLQTVYGQPATQPPPMYPPTGQYSTDVPPNSAYPTPVAPGVAPDTGTITPPPSYDEVTKFR